jgi:pyridoxal phosphate enzyme (YggS family)
MRIVQQPVKATLSTMPDLSDRLASVRETIERAASRAGRTVDGIELIAVSKTHSPEAIMEALEAGQTSFGESRVQEARAKIPLLPGRARWHFIGHLQKNKIRHALALNFELLHGVDSLQTAQDINRVAVEAGARPRVLIEVNLAAESTKSGFLPEKLRAQMEQLFELDRLAIDGLMCLPPPVVKAEDARKYFVELRELRERLQTEFRAPLPQLSMGMSGDYPVAVEEGATLVRVGTAIFGERSGKTWRPQADSAFDD